jgi:hypothetical protein
MVSRAVANCPVKSLVAMPMVLVPRSRPSMRLPLGRAWPAVRASVAKVVMDRAIAGGEKGSMSKSPVKAARPVGPVVDPLPPGSKPDLRPLHGRWVRLDPVSVARHAQSLYASFDGKDPDGDIWTYLGYGPWTDRSSTFAAWLKEREASRDPWFYAFMDRDGRWPCGMGSFMRSDPANGVIEIGHIWMSPAMQRTRKQRKPSS